MTHSTTKVPKTYESLAQTAERTEVSVKTLRRRIATGKLRAYRYGPRIIRVDPSDVDNLMRLIPNARTAEVFRPYGSGRKRGDTDEPLCRA